MIEVLTASGVVQTLYRIWKDFGNQSAERSAKCVRNPRLCQGPTVCIDASPILGAKGVPSPIRKLVSHHSRLLDRHVGEGWSGVCVSPAWLEVSKAHLFIRRSRGDDEISWTTRLGVTL
jgi:hypothetical protein